MGIKHNRSFSSLEFVYRSNFRARRKPFHESGNLSIVGSYHQHIFGLKRRDLIVFVRPCDPGL